MQIRVHSTQAGRRFDKFIRMYTTSLPLSYIYKLIRTAKIRCNNKKISIQYRVQDGDLIHLPDSLQAGMALPEPVQSKQVHVAISPREATKQSSVLWRNEHIVAICKAPATTVDSEYIHSLQRYAHSTDAYAYRPHPVHQLDTNTSGILLVARTLRGAQVFGSLFKERKIQKRYISIVEGKPQDHKQWQDLLCRDDQTRTTRVLKQSGDHKDYAITHVYPLQYNMSNQVSLIQCSIETGKTHQIRAQAKHHGHPLVGDKKYKSHWNTRYYLLHAQSYVIPKNECSQAISIRAPLTKDQIKILQYFHFTNPYA